MLCPFDHLSGGLRWGVVEILDTSAHTEALSFGKLYQESCRMFVVHRSTDCVVSKMDPIPAPHQAKRFVAALEN